MSVTELPTNTPDLSPDTDGSGQVEYRQAPQNLEAEEALLGAILINNAAYDRVNAFLRSEHFYMPVHGRIYDAAVTLINKGLIADPVTLKAFFTDDSALEHVGGPQYLAHLAKNAAPAVNATDYGRAIYDDFLRRQLIDIGDELSSVAYDASPELRPKDQIEDAEQKLFGLAEKGGFQSGAKSFLESVTESIEVIGNAYKRDGHLAGLSTGLSDLDTKLGGLHNSDLLILAGRPSMGKSALAMNIAFNVARSTRWEPDANGVNKLVDGAPVVFYSLEMSAEQLASRILAEQSEIDSDKLRHGNMTADEFSGLVEASRTLEELPLFIDDTPALSISALTTRTRRLKRQHNIGLVVVDYLQLLRGSSKNSEARVQEISEITQGLKALAKELQVPVIALSQLSRQVEARDDNRPQLSDLRESGSIEQDADAVMFVYREEYYLSRREPREGTEEHQKWQAEMEEVYGIGEVIIGKQRHGPIGTVRLQWEGRYTRFSNLADDDRMPHGYD